VALFAFESYAAAVRFDGPASDGQAQASTAPFPRSRFIDSEKAVEDIRLMFSWDSRSLIDHF